MSCGPSQTTNSSKRFALSITVVKQGCRSSEHNVRVRLHCMINKSVRCQMARSSCACDSSHQPANKVCKQYSESIVLQVNGHGSACSWAQQQNISIAASCRIMYASFSASCSRCSFMASICFNHDRFDALDGPWKGNEAQAFQTV